MTRRASVIWPYGWKLARASGEGSQLSKSPSRGSGRNKSPQRSRSTKTIHNQSPPHRLGLAHFAVFQGTSNGGQCVSNLRP